MSALQLSDDYPEVLALIAQTVDSRLRESGVDDALAAEIAAGAAEDVRATIGGAQIYISQGMRWEARRRNLSIIAALAALPYSDTGRYGKVATQFKLSERWIRVIEQSWLEEERNRRQHRLID